MYNWSIITVDEAPAKWPIDQRRWAPQNQCMGKFCGGVKYKHVWVFNVGAYFQVMLCDACAEKLKEALP